MFSSDDIPSTTQDFTAIFNILDDTIKSVLPKADVNFAPLIATIDPDWLNNPFCQDAYTEINRLIKKRKHVELDSDLPAKEEWIRGKDKVHMNDFDGIQFWKSIFDQLVK